MPTQRKGLLLPFLSDNSQNRCHTFPCQRTMIGRQTVKKMLNFPLSPLLCFSNFSHFACIQNLGILELWRIGLEGETMWPSFHRSTCINGVPVLWVLVFPPAWGVWNGAYLRIWHSFFSSWINFKMFCWFFMRFSHLPCLESTVMPYAVFPVKFLSVFGPTSLLYISGNYRDFDIDCYVNHLPLDIDISANVYFRPGRQ